MVSIYANLWEQKEIVDIKKEPNSHRICLEHQHGHHVIVLEHHYGHCDIMSKRPIFSQRT